MMGFTITTREIVGIAGVKRNHLYDGEQFVVRFENGYGASIIQHQFSYGIEGAVIHFTADGLDSFELVYDTPITNYVVGWMSADQVVEFMKQITALPPRHSRVPDGGA